MSNNEHHSPYVAPADDRTLMIESINAGYDSLPLRHPAHFTKAAASVDVLSGSRLVLGFRSGVHALRTYLKSLETIGVNPIGLNLRFNQSDIETTLQHLADELLPAFSKQTESIP